MQTPKGRINSSGTPPKISAQPVSLEVLEKSSPRAVSSEQSKKHVRQLKTSPRYSEPTTSSLNLATKPPKDRSPNVRKSPRSPLPEEKRPSRVAELEAQISQLENDLKNVRDQLCSSETSKKQAQKDAEESSQQLIALSSKLEESEKQIVERSASQRIDPLELFETTEENRTLLIEVEALQEQHSHDSVALATAFDEIKRLKTQLEMVAVSEAAQTKHSVSDQKELNKLRVRLEETLSVVEEMKNQLSDCKKSEAQAQELVGKTLMQLEAAKKMMESLRLDGCKATDAYGALASELEQSRARVNFLEELVSKLNAEISNAGSNDPQMKGDGVDVNEKKAVESNGLDVSNMKLEVEQLRAALEVSEKRHNEELARTTEQMRHAFEMVEQMKSASGQREAELEAELRKSRYEIEELKGNLMDKETELQSICEENDALIVQLENTTPIQREYELENVVQKLKGETEKAKGRLKEKEIECKNISEENETLKLEMSKADKMKDELEAARGAEREALLKIRQMTEEMEKKNRKTGRVSEQLEAAQAANAEMEAELRKIKVQSDQWRKAAEVAASMLSVGNNGQLVERTGSMDNNYSPRTRGVTSLYADDFDEDMLKKKNVNMLRRFGVLWKKPQK